MSLGRAFKRAAIAVAVAVFAGAALLAWTLMRGGAPLADGMALAGGKVTAVVERHGPVRIVHYLVALDDGGVVLIDAGMDPEAHATRAALRARGLDADAVRAVLVTHAHGDHVGGAAAFPRAALRAFGADAAALARGGRPVAPLQDGEAFEAGGTPIEAFAVPGHTPGSAAFLVHGVLFLGDAAASIGADSLATNDFAFTADGMANRRALAALARRLEPRRDAVVAIAFGHQGPVPGLAPLLAWARGQAAAPAA